MTSVESEPFRWLFVAHLKDGRKIEQSDKDHLPGSREFGDVLAVEKDLAAFELRHVDGKQSVAVDLVTGAFVVNGTPINIHDQTINPAIWNLRLIYFREVLQEAQAEATVQEDGKPKIGNIVPTRAYANRYFVGWQATYRGENIKYTVAVG